MPKRMLPDGSIAYYFPVAPWLSTEENFSGEMTSKNMLGCRRKRVWLNKRKKIMGYIRCKVYLTPRHAVGMLVHAINLSKLFGDKFLTEVEDILKAHGFQEDQIKEYRQRAIDVSYWSPNFRHDFYGVYEEERQGLDKRNPWLSNNELESGFRH